MDDIHRIIELEEAAATERLTWHLRQLISQHERLMISREMAGSFCHPMSWQIRSSYLSTLAMYKTLADDLTSRTVG